MASAAAVAMDKGRGTASNVSQPSRDGPSLSSDLVLSTDSHISEHFSCVNDYLPKARKPYTITKQRERWTAEEHKRFLEALKLYGRAWRRIEEHVGSKTAVQIRSHAQKFFSKVTRDSNTSNSSAVETIEIPPPRPKRKPMHPYPRKMSIKVKEPFPLLKPRSTSPDLSCSDVDNQSPTSVLSAIVMDSSDSSIPNQSYSTVSLHEEFQRTESRHAEPDSASELEGSPSVICLAASPEHLKESEQTDRDPEPETSTRSLKLFGRTVFVSESLLPSSPVSVDSKGEVAESSEKKNFADLPWNWLHSGKSGCSWVNFPHLNPRMVYFLPLQKNDSRPVDPWWTFPGNVTYSFRTFKEQEDAELVQDTNANYTDCEPQKEGSLTGSNSGSVNNEDIIESDTQSVKHVKNCLAVSENSSPEVTPCQETRQRGFMPYKKRKINMESQLKCL